MAFNVRIFAFPGTSQIPVINPQQFSSDSVQQLRYPYNWSQTIVAGAGAVSSAPVVEASPDATLLLRIEVPDGQAIRYEINPPNRPGGVLAAGGNSPILSGKDIFYFRPGWTVSVIDAAGLP